MKERGNDVSITIIEPCVHITIKLKKNIDLESQMKENGYQPENSSTILDKLKLPIPEYSKFIKAVFKDVEGNLIVFVGEKKIYIYFANPKIKLKKILEYRKDFYHSYYSKIFEIWRAETIFFKKQEYVVERLFNFSLKDPKIFAQNLIPTILLGLSTLLIWIFLGFDKAIITLISFALSLIVILPSIHWQRKKFKEEIFSLLPE